MAQIEKRGDRYKITVYLGKTPDGKRLFKRTTFRPAASVKGKEAEREARKYAEQFEDLAKNGGVMEGSRMTVLQFAEEVWTPWMDFQRDRHLTRLAYEDFLTRYVYPEIGAMKLSAVTPLHIQTIVDKINAKGLSRSAMTNTVVAASSIFSCAVKKHVISDNPCSAGRIDYPEKKPAADDKLHFFTAEQAIAFLDSLAKPLVIEHPACVRRNGRNIPARTEERTVNPQWRVYFNLAIFGGFRRGELIGLKWSDINYKEKTVTIRRSARKMTGGSVIKSPKTQAGFRTIVLPDVCMDLLRDLQKSRKLMMLDGFVFVQKDGITMMSPDSPGNFFKKHVAIYNQVHPEAPLPQIRLHDLRHTQATLLLAYGVDIETVRKRMGHSRASITLDIYGHAMEEMDRSASDILGRILSDKTGG